MIFEDFTDGLIFILAHETCRFGGGKYKKMDDKMQERLLEYYDMCYPESRIIARTTPSRYLPRDREYHFLENSATFFKFIILRGRRITPSFSTTSAKNSIIQCCFPNGKFVGQVIGILQHQQRGIHGRSKFFHVRWFRRLDTNAIGLDTSIWNDLYLFYFT